MQGLIQGLKFKALRALNLRLRPFWVIRELQLSEASAVWMTPSPIPHSPRPEFEPLFVRSLLNEGFNFGAYQGLAQKMKVPFSRISAYFCSFEGSREISKPAPNPGTHQTPVETLSDFDPILT